MQKYFNYYGFSIGLQSQFITYSNKTHRFIMPQVQKQRYKRKRPNSFTSSTFKRLLLLGNTKAKDKENGTMNPRMCCSENPN